MSQRSNIILCMSRNKIFAGDDSFSQQDLAPTTRRKSVHAFIKLCCYFYGHHAEEDHPLCSTFFLLLDLFDNPRTQLPGPRDSNYWCCYYGWCARSFHGTAFPSMDHQILRFLSDEHLDKKGGAVLPEFSSWRLVLQDTQLPMQPNDYDCGVFVSAFIYFSVLNLPFHRDSLWY
jgi:hypothetical protein